MDGNASNLGLELTKSTSYDNGRDAHFAPLSNTQTHTHVYIHTK